MRGGTPAPQAGRGPARSRGLDHAGEDRGVQLGRDAVPSIEERLGCHPETVRRRLHRFNAKGIDGLGDWPGPGRRPRLTEAERSRIIALVKTTPPGRPMAGPWLGGLAAAEEEARAAVWTLDTLTGAARAAGIDVHRSQIRRILLAEG